MRAPGPILAGEELAGLDPRALTAALAEAAGLGPGQAANASWSAVVLKNTSPKRSTLCFSPAPTDDGSVPAPSLVAKIYARKDKAARAYAHIRAVRALGDGRCRPGVPAPLLLSPELGLLLLESVEGDDLGQALVAGKARTPLDLAAAWLAQLHTGGPLPGLLPKPLVHELGKADRWLGELAAQLPLTDASALSRLEEDLHAAARRVRADPQLTIHRDFSYQNVLWDGEQLWILDFDELALGDPVFDVAHFVAHVERLAFETTGDPRTLRGATREFVEAYLDRNPLDLTLSLPFYKAYTFVKLAATRARRRRRGWLPHTRAMLDLASRELS